MNSSHSNPSNHSTKPEARASGSPEIYRTETDLLGTLQVPADALHGIHTERARANFAISKRPVNRHLVHAYGQVKLACVRTNRELHWFTPAQADALEAACQEMLRGDLDEHIVVDALQGGAGTSTNMNVNEVLANRALQRMGRPLGEYTTIHPLEHVNLHQSTNDTFPTALKIAAISQLRILERDLIELVDAFQAKERAYAHVVKVGRTQLQDAVLTTVGRTMAAFAEAFARDRWRIHKSEERLRVVNLGGTAIGTGVGAPRDFIFRAIDHLQHVTGFGLARAENLVDATQNVDAFVEVSGMLRALATNLLKVANDLRLLASGPQAGLGEIRLPPRQAGSSLMPGKVNPVIPEAVCQAALAISAHDQALMNACSQGNLELNQFLPLVADSLLTSLELATNACRVFTRFCVTGITVDEARCKQYVASSTATVTALVDQLGYETASHVAKAAQETNKTIQEVVLEMGLMSVEAFQQAVSPDSVMQLGSRTKPPMKERSP
jgi:aspartate ammonia-lyase